MESIQIDFQVSLSSEEAFQKFIDHFHDWWPAEYTWSQDKLEKIYIDGSEGGLCTEIGPHGFRGDWGRVTELQPGIKIAMKWQISPRREPIPDPGKASTIQFLFREEENNCLIRFEHNDFEKHGEGAAEYREMMASEYGWPYILQRFREFCQN